MAKKSEYKGYWTAGQEPAKRRPLSADRSSRQDRGVLHPFLRLRSDAMRKSDFRAASLARRNKKSELAIFGGKPVRTKLFPAYKYIGKEEKKAVNRVLDSGVLSRYLGAWHKDFYGGPEVQSFEKEWAKYFGVKYAVAVNSASSGIIAALGAIGIGPGDEVIVSPYSMSISATAPLFYGAIPVFVDIEKDYFCLDPKSVAKVISPRTKAIIVVDLFGQPYDARALNALAKKHKLVVIEDCAQAPGARLGKKYAGNLADIGVYSLNYHKHIHTGEGGVVVTNNKEWAERLELIRNHAESVVGPKGVKDLTNMVGYNFRLTELQAAIGREQLKKLRALNKKRIVNCNYLAKKLSRIPGISVPPVRKSASHVYYMQPFLYDEKIIGVSRGRFLEAIKAELPLTKLREGEGVKIGGGYVKPIYLLPIFQKRIAIGKKGFPFNLARKEVSYKKGICPVVEEMHEKKLIAHEFMRPPVTRRDLDDVVAAFWKVYNGREELKKTK